MMVAGLQNLSVRTKVIVTSVLVLVTTVALGLFAVQRLSVVNGAAAELRDSWLPAMRILGDLRYHATRYRSIEGSYLLPTSEADHDHAVADLKKYEGLIAADLEKLAPLADSDEKRALVSEITSQWSNYLPMLDEEIKLRKGQGAEAAAAYFTSDMKKAFNAFYKPIETAVDLHAEGGIKSGNLGQAAFVSARGWIFAALGIAVLLGITVSMFLIRAVSAPLVRMTDAMSALAAGRLEADVPHADQDDEIGKLAAAMTQFKNQLASADRAKDEQAHVIVASVGTGLERLAKGDLTHRITDDLNGPFRKLKDDFNTAMEYLQETLRKVRGSAEQIASGAGEISQAADDLSRRTEQQAASLEETAAALEEITTTVKGTAANAKRASENVKAATAQAEKGGHIVEASISAMDAIAQSAKQINDIIGVIDEIAFQTNLLALNAGVEAARAGEAGRGFAVVASEVRALAQRSSQAAKEIKALIHASGEQVGTGVKLAAESGDALKAMVAQIVQINGLVNEMADAAGRQSAGVEEVSSAVTQVERVTHQNAAMVEQSTAATRNLASETEVLSELIGFFQTGAEAGHGSSNVTRLAQASPRRTARG